MAHPVDIHVGRQIKSQRLARGLSQEEFGRRLELTFQQIQKYETGYNRVSASRLYEITQVLEVPVGYFFEGLDMTEQGPEPLDRALLELCRDFRSIRSPAVRTGIASLVRTLAKESSLSPPPG